MIDTIVQTPWQSGDCAGLLIQFPLGARVRISSVSFFYAGMAERSNALDLKSSSQREHRFESCCRRFYA